MFTVDELTMIKSYSNNGKDLSNKELVLKRMEEVLPLTEDEDIRETIKSAIQIASDMSQDDFNKIDLSGALEVVGEDY